MNFKKAGWKALLLAAGIGLVLEEQNLFAGTTFVTVYSNGTDNELPLLLSISSSGTVSSISAFATYGYPEGTAVDSNGNLYVAYSGDAILKYTTNGASLFVSGIGAPNLLCFDKIGNLYGNSNDCVIKISTNGAIVYASGIAGLNSFCFDTNGNLFASSGNQIVCITPSGTTNVFATASGITNGIDPGGIFATTIDGQGNVYAACFLYYPETPFVFRLGANGVAVWGVESEDQLPGEVGLNIAADEVTNIIYSEVFGDGFAIYGPFGSASYYPYYFAAGSYIYVSYTSINETLTAYETGTNPPSIISQPQPVTVSADASASFSVTATGSPTLNYQWTINSTNISGATASSLTISNVVQTNLGTYAVVVSNAFGSVTSSNALLSMYPFLHNPFSGAVTYWGQTNTLSVGAWGTGPLSYQWFDNGAAIQNATNQTLTLSDIQFTNAGLYSVVVTSPLGSVTNTPEQVVVNPAGVSLGFSPTLTINGVVGFSYIIQSTANLADTNSWVTLTNLILTQPLQIWVDTTVDASSPNNSKYFYRVLPGQ